MSSTPVHTITATFSAISGGKIRRSSIQCEIQITGVLVKIARLQEPFFLSSSNAACIAVHIVDLTGSRTSCRQALLPDKCNTRKHLGALCFSFSMCVCTPTLVAAQLRARQATPNTVESARFFKEAQMESLSGHQTGHLYGM